MCVTLEFQKIISSSNNLHYLTTIVQLFPRMDAQVLSSALSHILFLETAMHSSGSVNAFSYFAPVVASWWSKGLFLSTRGEDSVGKVTAQNRTKVPEAGWFTIVKFLIWVVN